MMVIPTQFKTFLGNNFQYYQDRCSLRNYARLCQMHLLLADYIDFLMDENTNLGKPVQRAMLWMAEVCLLKAIQSSRGKFAII